MDNSDFTATPLSSNICTPTASVTVRLAPTTGKICTRNGGVCFCGAKTFHGDIVGGEAMFSRWFQMLIFGYWLDCLLEVFP